MAAFPDIRPSKINEKIIKKVRKLEYTGYEKRSPKDPTAKEQFRLEFHFLRLTQRDELKQFFKDNQGLSFTFVHPESGNTHEVFFEMEEIEFKYISPIYRSTSIVLKEVSGDNQ